MTVPFGGDYYIVTMAKKLFIIDGHAHIYAAFYAPMSQKLTSPAGEPTKATYIFTNMILKLLETKKPDMLVVAMDSKEPSFRAEIYPEYKAHRPPMPDEMPVQINRIEQILEAMNIPIIRKSTFEADDIIGTLAVKGAKAGIEVYICSKDKDMLQLLGNKGVYIYDVKTDMVTDAKSFKEETGLESEQFIDVLALQGDASDNVPGVADVGPKTAIEWVKQYSSLENLYKHADEITGKRGDNLRSSKDTAFLSRKLVTLNCEMPIDIDKKTFAVKEFDNEKLAAVFTELGFNRLLAQLNLKPVEKKEEEEKSQEKETAEISPAAGYDSIKTVKHIYHLIDTPEKLDDFVSEIKKQRLFAVDTETTSISAHRAELVGISFCWQVHTAYYLAVKSPMGSKSLGLSKVKQKLASILADEKIRKIGQNAKYDQIVLHNSNMPLKGLIFDTMIASYVLDAERSHSLDNMTLDFLSYQKIPTSDLIGKGKNQSSFDMVDTASACDYSCEDADFTFQLYQYLSEKLAKEPKLKQLFEEIEMPLVEVLTAIELNGVKVDVQILRQMSVEINKQLEKTTEKIYGLAGGTFNIDSPKQLSEILFDRLGLQSLREGKTGHSTDAGVLDELADRHPIIEQILQHRQLSKLKNTYTDKLGSLINPRSGRVHASFNQTITATGRLSSSDPNLQNIPIRTEIGKKIRAAFVPEKTTDKILSLDYSQIELRMVAHFSGDRELKKAFELDKDIHSFVASQIYNVDIKDVTSDMRSRCKAVNFGLIYGQGSFGLSKTTSMNIAEARKFIDNYFARYKSIQQFKKDAIEKAKKIGFAETICGRRRKITGLESKNGNVRSQAERLVINTLIQGSAADLIKVAMIKIQKRIEQEKLPAKMILQIHDELVFEADGKEAEKLAKIFSDEMTGAIKLNVPLKVDITIGKSWLAE